MPRLIDADALKAKYEQMLPEIGDGYHKETLQDVLFELEYAPTISPDEVRGVVHCGECIYSAVRESEILCPAVCVELKPYDYCSHGVKREATSDV